MTRALRVFIIAGEPSGDQLGAHLMRGFALAGADVQFSGIGGPMMAAEGLQSLFDMSDLSVMGIVEVLPKLPKLLSRIRETADAVIGQKPDILVTIDSPDFCLRVAKKVKTVRPDQATVHYVAPSVWAWRPERAQKMVGVIDHVLALLPFEPPYMEAVGLTCDFVGHPVARFPVTSQRDAEAFRIAHDIKVDAPLLCVLPGSRKSEIRHHGPVFRDVLQRLANDVPQLRSVIPVAPAVQDLVHEAFADAATQPIFVEHGELDEAAALSQKLAAYSASNAALAVSGTVSIELASQRTPMVIAYTTNRLTQWIIKRKFLLDTATLVNLVSDTRTVPEYIFDRFDADLITTEIKSILQNGDAAQLDACDATMLALGRGGDDPGQRAAQSILNRFP